MGMNNNNGSMTMSEITEKYAGRIIQKKDTTISNLTRRNAAMSNDLSARLQGYLAKAAESNPAPVVFVCDMSTSMDKIAGKKKRVDHLRDALRKLLVDVPAARIVRFDFGARLAAGVDDLGEPRGGTYMHAGIDLAATIKAPATIVISDGEPMSEDLALQAAAKLPGKVHTIFVGDEGDATAIEFMRRLAQAKGGTYHVRNLADTKALSLERTIRGLLPA